MKYTHEQIINGYLRLHEDYLRCIGYSQKYNKYIYSHDISYFNNEIQTMEIHSQPPEQEKQEPCIYLNTDPFDNDDACRIPAKASGVINCLCKDDFTQCQMYTTTTKEVVR